MQHQFNYDVEIEQKVTRSIITQPFPIAIKFGLIVK